MTVPFDLAMYGRRWRWKPLIVATVGLGLNLRAWILLGPRLAQRPDVGPGKYVLLMALPLVVAALSRLPVGVLTDRYGARVMLPAVSLAAAAAVLGLSLTDSLPVIVAAGAVAGVAGTAFVVGGALVSRTIGYGRRGLALGLYTLATVIAIVISVVSWSVDPVGRRAGAALGAALVAFAVVAALLLRGAMGGYRGGSQLQRCAQTVRQASSTSLSLLYALALGGVVASAVYLPTYLTAVFGLTWLRALAVTGVAMALAALARLAGGWWTDRRPTARLLMICYAAAAALALVVAVAPHWWWLTVALLAALAVCDGVASGALLALIGKAARPDSIGAVMGATGSAAAFGAAGLPLLLAGVDQLTGWHRAGWILLGAALLAVALYVRAHGLRIGLGLAVVQAEPQAGPTAITIAVVRESETRWGAAAVVARLADLATHDELVVVYGYDQPQPPHRDTNVLVTGLRERLPRHTIAAVRVAPYTGSLDEEAAQFREFVECGVVPIAVTPTADLGGVAAQLSTHLRADRMLKMSYTLATGADLHKVWDRRAR